MLLSPCCLGGRCNRYEDFGGHQQFMSAVSRAQALRTGAVGTVIALRGTLTNCSCIGGILQHLSVAGWKRRSVLISGSLKLAGTRQKFSISLASEKLWCALRA